VSVIEIVTHSCVLRIENASLNVTTSRTTSGGIDYYVTRATGASAQVSLATPAGGSYINLLPGGFQIDKDSDSAYQPTEIGADQTIEVTRED